MLRTQRRLTACSFAVSTKKGKERPLSQEERWNHDNIPNVGQHLENEHCTEPGKPVYGEKYLSTRTCKQTEWLFSQHSLSHWASTSRRTMKALFQLWRRKPLVRAGADFNLDVKRTFCSRTLEKASNIFATTLHHCGQKTVFFLQENFVWEKIQESKAKHLHLYSTEDKQWKKCPKK